MEIKGNSFAQVYGKLLNELMNNPEYESSPRDQKTKEITDTSLIIEDPSKCIYKNKRRSSQLKYIAAELIWYFSGDRSTEYITRYAEFWNHIAKYDVELKKPVVNSAYGNLIFKERNVYDFSQYYWAFNSLAQDKDSRQAILHFNNESHQYEDNLDFVCTLTGMFMIRNNKLNLSVNMRSNDAILGLPTDVPFFCTLQQHMLYHLKPLYPDLELGTYKHNVHSMHIYEKHFDLINDMLEHNFEADTLPEIEKSFINMDGSATQLTRNLFDWANDDIREKFIVNESNEFIEFLQNNLTTEK